ncbi:MAG: serine hydrolase domain-containing protein [Bdellovibrionales bacterium]
MGKIIIVFLAQMICVASYGDTYSDLEALVKKYHYRQSFHGNVLVRRGGEILFEKSIGEANAEWKVPHTMDSKFMVASLSKSFTAAMILLMEARGDLSVEDAVSSYISLPKEPVIDEERWFKLKIKHLLNHTGGVKRDFMNTANLNRSGLNRLGGIIFNTFTNKKVFISDPGEKFYYSNLGYVLLGAVIEKVSSSDYENALKNNMLRQAELYDTGEFHRMKYLEYMSSGYFYGSGRRITKRCCDDATSLTGAASMYSTASDLANWLTLLRTSSEVFGVNLLERMTGETVEGDVDGMEYGYGLMRGVVGGADRVYHTGHEWGFVSSMNLYPEENLEIVVLANRHGFMGGSNLNSADALSIELAEYLLLQ